VADGEVCAGELCRSDPEAAALGPVAVPPPKALDVFNICFAANREARSFEPPHTELHSIEGHHFDRLLAQVVNKP